MTPAQQAQIAIARQYIRQGWTDSQLRGAGIAEAAIRAAHLAEKGERATSGPEIEQEGE